MNLFNKKDVVPGLLFIGILVIIAMVQSVMYQSHDDDCSLDNFAAEVAAAWETNGKISSSACYASQFESLGRARAREISRDVEAILAQRHPKVGYKVGIHEPSEQPFFGLDGPLFGVFYGQDALKENGATVTVDGQYFNFEPDFLLRVGDTRINEASSIEEAAQYIDRVYAFIELPVFVHNFSELNDSPFVPAVMMQGTNLGARYGIIGDFLHTASDPDIIENLRTMTVVASDHKGRQKSIKHQEEDETNLLVTALMTADFLRERNDSLKVGDVISVGSMGAIDADWDEISANSKIRHVHYYIGETVLSVSVRFN
jgi:2-keto-4-pentenoate hydratase